MKLNIQTKLLGSFGLMIVLMIAVFGVGFWGMNTIANDTTEIVLVDLPEDIGVRELEVLILEQTATYENFVITQNEEDLTIIEHETEEVHEHFTALEEQFHGDVEMLELLYIVEDEYVVFLEAGDELVRLVQANASREDIIHELELLEADERLLEEELELLAAAVEHNIDLAYEDALANKSLATTIAIGVLVVSILAGITAGIYISRTISRGVNAVARSANDLAENTLPSLVSLTQAVARGDLTQRSSFVIERINDSASDETGDLARSFNAMAGQIEEVGSSMDEMVVGLQDVVGLVARTATEVASASEQLASIAEEAGSATANISEQAQDLSRGAQEQDTAVSGSASAVKQLGSAIDQIAGGTQQQSDGVDSTSSAIGDVSRAITEVAKNAQEAAEGSHAAGEAASKGLGIVEQTVQGMDRINGAVMDVADQIGKLGQQSSEIGKIVAVIDDIAAQTNLLALNAAIEAARAGEQGRGFAVVADEVRQLAERVTQATSEIANLIDGVQKGVEESVRATEKGTAEAEQGSKLAAEAGDSLGEIQEAVRTVTQQVELISSAAEDVAASSSEMVKSIESVSTITEQTTAASEEMAATNSEVQRSMEQITTITQQTVAAVERSSASTEELSAQIEEVVASAAALGDMSGALTTAVSVFKLSTEQAGEGPDDNSSANEVSETPMPEPEEDAA